MSRHYSSQDHEFALQRLVFNRGDVTRTAAELGIAPRTLYKWRKKANIAHLPLTTLQSVVPIDNMPLANADRDTLPADDLQALITLKARMLELADYIVANDEIKRAVDEAPLNQRIAALVQLTDRIIKLAAQLPEPEQEYVFRLAGEPEDMDEEDGDTDFITGFASESGDGL